MPKSRTREKTIKKYQTQKNSINDMGRAVSTCGTCAQERLYYEFIELPITQQKLWHYRSDFNKIEFFLYCTECDEYSGICLNSL